MKFTTAPGILIAVPSLHDPNFVRSVVVMIEHAAEGAVGLVVNQPMPHTCVDITRELGVRWAGPPDARLRRGGPVEPQSLWMLHDDGWGFDETTRVAPGMAVSRSREALERMCSGEERNLLLVVGCASWGPGQLDAEIATGAWITSDVTAAMVFDWPPQEMWDRALRRMGVDPAHLVESERGSIH
jgi:putative transcriptional regulator